MRYSQTCEMAWLGEGLSSLRGQITSFTKEVLSEGREDDSGQEVKLRDAEEKIQQLESLCIEKDIEISKLHDINASLEKRVTQLINDPRKQEQQLLYHVCSSSSLGEFPRVYSFEDLGNAKKESAFDFSSMETEKDDLVDYLRAEIRALKIEKEKVEKKLQVFQNECKCSDSTVSTKTDCDKDSLVSIGTKSSEVPSAVNQQPENNINTEETEMLTPMSGAKEYNASQVESPDFNELSDESSQSLVNAKSLQKAQLIRAHQDMVNRIIQRGDKTLDGDISLKKYHMEKQHPSQFIDIIKSLDESEEQNVHVQGSAPSSERRVNFSGEIAFVDGMESASKNWRIEDARGECDGSEEMPKEMVKLMDQISKLTISLSDAQLNVNKLQEKEKQWLNEMDRLKAQELITEDNIRQLKAQLVAAQESNVQKLEELDKQHLLAIEQVISVKSSLQQKNEALQTEIEEFEQKVSTLESQLQMYSANSNMFNMNESSVRREVELEMEKKILKFIPPELIPGESGNSGELSVMVGAVKGLAKLCEELRWKKETTEKKMAEMMKEAREAKAECLQLRAEIARRENGSGLRTEGLEPILETGEEEEEDEDAVDGSLQESIQNANFRTAMENELAVSNGDKLNLQKRCRALEEEIKKLLARERKESDFFDEEDDDDADGTEEANDWTWQANMDPKKSDVYIDKALVKHTVAVPEDSKDTSLLQSEVESCTAIKHSTPTLTEQYIKEKSKLEKLIEELQEQKQTLQDDKENAEKTVVKLEEIIKNMTEKLESKSNTSADLESTLKQLEEKISLSETEREHLEKHLAEKSEKVKELEYNIKSLTIEFENERKKNDEMRKTIFDLNGQISQFEFVLKDKDELLNKQLENVKVLEDENVSLQQLMKSEEEAKEEKVKYISQLEEKLENLQNEFTKETILKDGAIKEAREASEKNVDIDLKLSYEIQLKEEALNKLSDVEERFKIVEESINNEMKTKNEFTDRIMELERKLLAVQEESSLERKLKDEAVLCANEQKRLIASLENELSIVKHNMQERENSFMEYQNKLSALEMERERIMCVVGDKAREISSLRSERQRLMEAMSLMEKIRQKELVGNDSAQLSGSSNEVGKIREGSDPTETPSGEKEEIEDDGTIQLLSKLKSLQLESEQLAESYRQEQQRNKHLQNEVHEMMEKEASLIDELNRLRQHLVDVEDRYTKEAIGAQDHIAFLKSKLTQVEERLHASSSAYTSASVRCNQQVESLENQVRALTEKKDESKNRLMAAEEQLAQQAKDLANLQSVLEQFQKDKEREICIVKDKMGKEISTLESKCGELLEEISSLKEQLIQAKEGLSAASRLSEQVDKKSEIIASLKTEMKKLNANVISAEEKLQNATLNIEGKVEKNLVKNLLLGYLSAPPQGPRRGEILRIIATILEFSQDEKERIDLDGSGKGLGWLRGIAGWGGQHKESGDLNQPSLSEAFIRFLENESRPKSQIRMLSDSRVDSNRSSSPASGQSSVPSTSSTPPLLMSESILPTLPTFSVASGSNSSCILKDVLKDS